MESSDPLPDLIATDCSDEELLTRLVSVWFSDFKNAAIMFQGIPVYWDQQLGSGSVLENGFWHLVSRVSPTTGDRILDRSRASRLRWCPAILRRCPWPDVLIWHSRGARIRTNVWHIRGEYVIVLEDRSHSGVAAMHLVTAFHVDGRATERKLRKQYLRQK